jgi:hypothetical protein
MSDTIWDREADAHLAGQDDIEWIEEEAPEQEIASKDIFALLNTGQLAYQLDVRGHNVSLRTLTMEEELGADMLISKYEGTMAYGRAQATVYVAAAIESIDGRPLVLTLGPDEDVIRRKFDYVKRKMYWPVIKLIYEEGYIPLIERQALAIEEFRKKS